MDNNAEGLSLQSKTTPRSTIQTTISFMKNTDHRPEQNDSI